jgi:hypothetical protein
VGKIVEASRPRSETQQMILPTLRLLVDLVFGVVGVGVEEQKPAYL